MTLLLTVNSQILGSINSALEIFMIELMSVLHSLLSDYEICLPDQLSLLLNKPIALVLPLCSLSIIIRRNLIKRNQKKMGPE